MAGASWERNTAALATRTTMSRSTSRCTVSSSMWLTVPYRPDEVTTLSPTSMPLVNDA
ncbi:MAG: hypothetical protein IPH81_06765 [Candidatus Microthrix sp.]|nr:hypothetical protein [Candidatus Microthrix sp.]